MPCGRLSLSPFLSLSLSNAVLELGQGSGFKVQGIRDRAYQGIGGRSIKLGLPRNRCPDCRLFPRHLPPEMKCVRESEREIDRERKGERESLPHGLLSASEAAPRKTVTTQGASWGHLKVNF